MNYISLFSSAGVGCFGFKVEGFDGIATSELIERRLNVQKINNPLYLSKLFSFYNTINDYILNKNGNNYIFLY